MSGASSGWTVVGQILRSYAKLLVILLPVGAVLVYLRTTLDPGAFVQLTQATSLAFMGLMVLLTLARFRRERPINRAAQKLAILTPLATLGVYLFLYDEQARLYFLLMIPAGIVGLILGAVWSRATKLTVRDRQVYGRNAGWWLVLWALTFMATQAMVLLGRREGMNISLVVMAFGSGVAVGTARGILGEIDAVLRRAAGGTVPLAAAPAAASAHSAGFCEQCGRPLEPGARFCESCGAAVGG